MSSRLYPSAPLLGACVAIWRDGQILLAERGKDPNRDTWAMPGGMVELGETFEEAARREVIEETGLLLNNLTFNRMHEIIRRDDAEKISTHFVLAMFAAEAQAGDAVAGDDASDVRWFTLDDIDAAKTTPHTKEFALESLKILSL